MDFLTAVRARVPDVDKIKPIGAYIRWAIRNRPRDAMVVLLEFTRFLIRMRLTPDPARRFGLLRVLSILQHTCYSCTFTEEARRDLELRDSGVLVVGHTHRAMLAAFSARHTYVNTGTWNPILTCEDGRFTTVHHRTYALYVEPREVRLLKWCPGQGAVEFNPTFFNVHLHEDR